MNPLTQSKYTTIPPVLIALTLGCFALSPRAQAVCQEGCDGDNTFLGEDALVNNTSGDHNTAIGSSALSGNSTGNDNTATGFNALLNYTTGHQNTATGSFAMGGFFGSTGSNNTATGYQALLENTTGDDNTATGAHALYFNQGGNSNTATGFGRSLRTPPARTTSHWADSLGAISPQAIIISISATWGWRESPTPFASAQEERRQEHLLPASVGRPFQQV